MNTNAAYDVRINQDALNHDVQVDFEKIIRQAAMNASGFVYTQNPLQHFSLSNANTRVINDDLKKETKIVSGPASRFIR